MLSLSKHLSRAVKITNSLARERCFDKLSITFKHILSKLLNSFW